MEKKRIELDGVEYSLCPDGEKGIRFDNESGFWWHDKESITELANWLLESVEDEVDIDELGRKLCENEEVFSVVDIGNEKLIAWCSNGAPSGIVAGVKTSSLVGVWLTADECDELAEKLKLCVKFHRAKEHRAKELAKKEQSEQLVKVEKLVKDIGKDRVAELLKEVE
jgi:hypothetical protein